MNFKKKLIRVDTDIYVVFVILIAISVFNAIYNANSISSNQRITTKVIEVETPSIETIAQLNELVTSSKMYATNWVYLPYHNEDKQKLLSLINVAYPELKSKLTEYVSHWNSQSDSLNIYQSMAKTEALFASELKVASLLKDYTDYENLLRKNKAEEIIQDEILPHAERISEQLNGIINSKQARLNLMHIEIQNSYQQLIWNVFGMALILIVAVFTIAFYLSHYIIAPVMKLKDYILSLGRGEIPTITYKAKNKAIDQMTKAIIDLSESFTKTARIAYEIGEGRFDVHYHLSGSNDELGIAIINMRDKLKLAQFEVSEYTRQLQLQNEILVHARKELFEKAKELEQANKYKSEFFANISHELRTPLNSLLILVNILAENRSGNLSTKEIEYAQIIRKSGSELLALINDILDMSKIEAGKLELIFEEVNVRSLAREMQSSFEQIALEKKINFSIEIASDVPETIVTDRLRLSQVIRNLLSNAFKFTNRNGEVILKLKNIRSDHALTIEFSVHDNGIGIPEEKQQIIFQAFSQADGSTSRKYGGTGLGLSICKLLADLLHGVVGLKSKENEGSIFSFRIPVKPEINALELKESEHYLSAFYQQKK